MFVYYFAHIPLPFAQLTESFTNHPDLWLPGNISEAYAAAASLAPTGGTGANLFIEVGPIGQGGGSITFPFRIDAAVTGALFTHLEADLEISELGPGHAQLTLRGSYRALKRSQDGSAEGLRHRAVEAITKGIVERVASRLAGAAVAAPLSRAHAVTEASHTG